MPKRGKASRGEPYRESKPVAGPDAFKDLENPDHVHSQAATLLLIGAQLRGDPQAMQARAEAASAVATLVTAQPVTPPLPERDYNALGFPRMRVEPARFHPADMQRTLGVRFAAAPSAAPPPRDVRAAVQSLPQAADSFYRDANPQTAASLLEAGLRHPQELVRVSAAASYFDVATTPRLALGVLERGLASRNFLTRDVAAYALARLDPANPKLAKVARPRRMPSRRRPSRTSTIVHGTWAAGSSWWQPPAGDFWNFLHDNVDVNLYAAGDRFGWTGGYSDAARSLGGDDLHNWVQSHHLNGLDLFAHSHGGSVSMIANHEGTQVGRMVLLSCPVHWPKYTPDFTQVGRVISVRVHLDLVILADRGGQLFQDPRIEEHVLGVWFDHFATHQPDVWNRFNIRAWL